MHSEFLKLRAGLLLLVVYGLLAGLLPTATAASEDVPSTITVSGTQWGQSTCYIGAVEGSSRFTIADLKDLGINTFHMYGGMTRWEPQDDSPVYGSPSINQIKANPNVINWAYWDNIMTNPPAGSDYWWTGNGPLWQGNARTIFRELKAAGIRPVVTLRNHNTVTNPAWAPNPPTTQADWNVWWEHVFATVYWLNVRNDYNVNDFEIHNEPNLPDHGWGGTFQQYIAFARATHDAIDYVYKTYLPGRTYHLFAPSANTSSSWTAALLQQAPDAFDNLSIHDYAQNNFIHVVEQAHQAQNQLGKTNYPLWVTEWGSYSITDKYSSISMGIKMIQNLIQGSQPGNDYVYGSQIFALYDYATRPLGLIASDGTRRVDYYALRMAIRALQGCRPTFQSMTTNPNLLALTTRDAQGHLYLLVTNQDTTQTANVSADLSALTSGGNGTIWQFDYYHSDQQTSTFSFTGGHLAFSVPANGALLLKIA
ncbi:hypothetical protein [Tengunoibacter tsumagoiensis]|uniref:Glycoside hydrolase family 5 domain-containing protein n=1 Tax=Tengunoibacter tsumagoiensis TaxID=2014871 RepID=A0A402A0K5_9CHLR|nr:hypothetical protein [Tengunoibacter tsumagoiensis]GCE12644.1 hypothetical protein KTT_25030 [Tengunoibacter tsumagoiensis]